MSGGYALHPEAFIDIDEIAAYIGQKSTEAAHRVVKRYLPSDSADNPFPK